MWHAGPRIGRIHRAAFISSFLSFFTFCCSFPFLLHAQKSPVFDSGQRLSYEERLRFYLDATTKDFLVEMAAKELVLLQTVENLTSEIRARGVPGIVRDDPGFSKLYHESQEMISSYQEELNRIIAIVDEINNLSATLHQEKRYETSGRLADLKAQLIAALENRELDKKALSKKAYAANLIRDHDSEVDSLLRIYRRLEKFERSAQTREDTTALRLVTAQKNLIQSVMAEVGDSHEVDPELTDAYVREAQNIITLLTNFEELEKREKLSVDVSLEIEETRRNLISRLDKRIVELLGYAAYHRSQHPTISEIFQIWRSAQIADYAARSTEYSIIKTSLLTSGTDADRRRMLERDLSDALLNYASARYRAAELQFDSLLGDYGRYFNTWDTVVFFRAESLYGRAIYQQAVGGYEQIVKEYPSSKYYPLSLLRLVTIAHTIKQPELFFTYYNLIDANAASIDQKIVDRARYLCGYYQLQRGNYADAENSLVLIQKDSKYFPAGTYLSGVAKASQGNLTGALQNFKDIAEAESVPWSDPTTAVLRNSARLKIGFIYYESGELDNAVKYFDSVSRGAPDYDQSVLGRAWANVKRGNYLTTIAQVNELFQNYISSNYTYEALVLSAHCRRLLNQPEAALDELRYVTNARGVLELSNDYNEERRQIVSQMSEVERLEEKILDRQDRPLYYLIAEVRTKLQAALFNLNYRGGTSNTMLTEFANERALIYKQIQELDYLIAQAQDLGMDDAATAAIRQSNRLITALETYQGQSSAAKVNYFINYPLAIKESEEHYRRELIANILRDTEDEQRRIQADLSATEKLAASLPKERSANTDLEILQNDLKNLQYRMGRFQTWLSTYEVDDVQTDFNHWADFSGFGLSDISMQALHKLDRKINDYSEHLASIEALLHIRKQGMQDLAAGADRDSLRSAREKAVDQFRAGQFEQQKNFESIFFDNSSSEVIEPTTKTSNGEEESKLP